MFQIDYSYRSALVVSLIANNQQSRYFNWSLY